MHALLEELQQHATGVILGRNGDHTPKNTEKAEASFEAMAEKRIRKQTPIPYRTCLCEGADCVKAPEDGYDSHDARL
ncbi:hypothetical protein PSCICO_09500 [Pseudomonas cichorii]|nr:hypothetical protein PSCICO_09500 [Pseudomonas cichorii]